MSEQGADGPRYKAFLSYSHKDAAAAARIHRRLESYRLPRRLVGQQTERGPAPQRLWPIFRDRDEMAASSDLSETVRAALAESAALVVLCSPDAAASRWVSAEIATFRRLHPDRPVLAAIIAGKPPDCFPEPLRAAGSDGASREPLATDLRREGDGAHLGLLKLVAGLTGVGLDDLVQRDASRRVRRVTTVTAIAVAATLIMAALTIVTFRAQREAERQSVEAEGMIEFMLTDLRRELTTVGRLDIMSAVNERALSYYERQQDFGNSGLRSVLRARVDHTTGEDLLTRGDTDAAFARFRRAHRQTRSLISQRPDDPGIVFAHAQSEFWIGRVHEVHRNWPAAQQQYRRFAGLAARLLEMSPGNAEYMIQVAWSAVDEGNLQLNGTRDFAAAQRYYEKAIYWFRRATLTRPRDTTARLAQANAYAWLADSFYMRQLWSDALRARLQQYNIVESLHRADPGNAQFRFRLAAAERAVGGAYFKVGDFANARSQLFRAYGDATDLILRDPRNTEWLLLATFVSCDLYYYPLGLPDTVTPHALRSNIRAAERVLRAQNNPRVSEFSNCVNNLH